MRNWRKINFFLIFIVCSYIVNAQDYTQFVVEQTVNSTVQSQKQEPVFGFKNKHSWNPFSLLMSSAMFIYQKFISPEISASCLYEPSCSSFSKQLISEYGLIKGTATSADRLMRCNRLGGHDLETHQIDIHTGKSPEDISIYKLKSK